MERSKEIDKEVREKDKVNKEKMIRYADEKRHTRKSLVRLGNSVLLKQKRENTLTPYYDPRPYKVIGIKGSMVTVKRGREIKSRNSMQLKRVEENKVEDEEYDWTPDTLTQDSEEDNPYPTHREEEDDVQGHSDTPKILRRSSRVRTSTMDTKYKDYER